MLRVRVFQSVAVYTMFLVIIELGFTIFVCGAIPGQANNESEEGIERYYVPLGGTVSSILVNISEHKHADAFLLTGDDYFNDRIKKTTTKDRAEFCYQGDWLERCKWINLTFVGDDMVRVDIRVINETMAVIYKVYAYCIGAINRCSHLPLKEFIIGLQEPPPEERDINPTKGVLKPAVVAPSMTSKVPTTNKIKNQGSSSHSGIAAPSNLVLVLSMILVCALMSNCISEALLW